MALNLGYHNFPHDSLNYFDNFQLIWAVALHQGFSFGAGPSSERSFDSSHIKSFTLVRRAVISQMTFRHQMIDNQPMYETLPKLEKEKFRAAAFSYYAHLLLLENTKNSELMEHYGPVLFTLWFIRNTIQDLFRCHRPQKVKQMDLVIAHLRKARRGN